MEKSYIVTDPIQHNGKRYEIGSNIVLNDEDAETLRSCIEGEGTEITPAKPPVVVPEGEAKIAAIREAITKLNVDNAELWTGKGQPSTAAIAAITGWDVSAAERNEAFPVPTPTPAS